MNHIAQKQSEIRDIPDMLKVRLELLDSCDVMTIFRHNDKHIEIHRDGKDSHHYDIRVVQMVGEKRVLITELIIPEFLNKHGIADVCGCNVFIALLHACRTVVIVS